MLNRAPKLVTAMTEGNKCRFRGLFKGANNGKDLAVTLYRGVNCSKKTKDCFKHQMPLKVFCATKKRHHSWMLSGLTYSMRVILLERMVFFYSDNLFKVPQDRVAREIFFIERSYHDPRGN